MQTKTMPGMIFGLLLFCCGGVLVACEADELRERATGMRKEASVLAEQGNKEQAERLEQEAAELMETAERMELKSRDRGKTSDRPETDKEVHQLKDRLQDLLARERELKEKTGSEQESAEVREQISGIERELKQIHAHHAGRGELPLEFRARAEKQEIASRRIHHLQLAAQNLKMAEEHDLAHKLLEKAEVMQREVQEARQQLTAEMQGARERHGENGPDVVRELKAEIERLTAEVKELRQNVEQR